MARSTGSNDSGQPTPPDVQAWRYFGDGFAGRLVAARLQGWDAGNLQYVDVAVDADGNLSAAAGGGGGGTVAQGAAGTQAWKVDGSAVTQPVSIAATVPVSGPLTDTQLRAVAVPVSLASLPALAAGSAVIGHVIVDTAPTTAVTGPLTDTQLRASAVPVSLATVAVTNTGTFAVQAAVSNFPASQAVTGSLGRTWALASATDTVAITGQAADLATTLPSVVNVLGGWDGSTVRVLTARAKDGVNMLHVADQQVRGELEQLHLLLLEQNDILRQLVGERPDVI